MLRRGWLTGALLVGLVACTQPAADEPEGEPSHSASQSPRKDNKSTRQELPRPGTRIFPRYRVVAFYGGAGTDELGVLGEGSPQRAADRLQDVAKTYRGFGRPVMPALELITSVATSAGGEGGDYSSPTAFGDIKDYLKAARSIDGLLILDIQPGRSSFLSEVKRYERFLKDPDVSLALDPEWHMAPGKVPGEELGSTTAGAINEVSAYLAAIVRKHDLPQKLLVVHQFADTMIKHRDKVKPRDGLAITFHIDGFGTRAAKLSKYEYLRAKPPFRNGFKLFYDEDVNMFSPKEVMNQLHPRPDLITYQ